jgi:glucose/arabinose dehydrogenase
MEQPLYHYTPSIAPSGMEFYTGDAFPDWRGSVLIGAMAHRHLNRLILDGERVVAEERLLTQERWRVRVVRQGPEGFVYLAVDEGFLIRLRPLFR